VFGNRYRLIEKIGIGGMAEVYKATDEVLGRTVAVKVMLPQYASDPTFAARFKQEAQSAANLQSPYIVNIYDWGHDEADNTYFIVMEYVRGTDLKTAIQQRGAINKHKAAEIASQVCAALSVAHSYDIIHRDIKPHNIMVQPDGNAKVMDFGIARANGSTMTQTGSVLGTAYYVSPEQAQGRPLTSATDIYSLGVVLYEATTGQVPFDAPDAVAVAVKQVNEQPVPPAQINPAIDPELEAIILRALAKDPLERYATAEQMRTALNNYLAGRPVDTGVEQPAAVTRVMGAAGVLPVIGADGAQDGLQPPAHTAVMPSVSSASPLNVRSSARAAEEQKKKKNRTRAAVITVIAVIVCIAAIAAAVYFLMPKGEEKARVPNVVGATEQEARKAISDAKLATGAVSYEAHATMEKDRVIQTKPSADTEVNRGTAVELVLSSGPEPPKQVEVPNLYSLSPDAAKTKLEGLNLQPSNGGERFDATVPAGSVCAQDQAAGGTISEGSTVTFYVSKGKETGVVPGVVDQPKDQAVQYLKDAGFEVEYAEAEHSDKAVDVVIRQTPPSGATQDKGTTVTLTLSLGPESVTVPNLAGKTREEAASELAALGLFVEYQSESVGRASQVDKVVRQDPAKGAAVSKNSTVTVYIGTMPDPGPDPDPGPSTGGSDDGANTGGGSGTGGGTNTGDESRTDATTGS
jgi:serine/threonine-protein kinase